jgi:hypothetical protein
MTGHSTSADAEPLGASPPRCYTASLAKPVILAVDDDPDVLRAIARDLRQHYGRLTVDSRPGRTELAVRLPLS